MGKRAARIFGHRVNVTRAGLTYQLDFVTPGIMPADASSRNVMRESLKRRMKARRRPLIRQRLTKRVGLASRGNIESANVAAFGVVDVEHLLVGRERESVRLDEIPRDHGQRLTVRRNTIDALEIQF